MTSSLLMPLLAVAAAVVIYVAYQIGKVMLRLFVGLAVLGLVSWGLWKVFHS